MKARTSHAAYCEDCGHLHRRRVTGRAEPCTQCGGEVRISGGRLDRMVRLRLELRLPREQLELLGPRPALAARWILVCAIEQIARERGQAVASHPKTQAPPDGYGERLT